MGTLVDSLLPPVADPLPLEHLRDLGGVARLEMGSNCTGTPIGTGVPNGGPVASSPTLTSPETSGAARRRSPWGRSGSALQSSSRCRGMTLERPPRSAARSSPHSSPWPTISWTCSDACSGANGKDPPPKTIVYGRAARGVD